MNWAELDASIPQYLEHLRREKYQRTRVLARPKTTKWTVAWCVLLLLLLVGLPLTALWMLSDLSGWINLLISVVFVAIVLETYGRFLGIKAVECYQHYADEKTRRKCKCIPSCSEYAILCFQKYELVYALLKIRKRLYVTCQGFEYIVDNP